MSPTDHLILFDFAMVLLSAQEFERAKGMMDQCSELNPTIDHKLLAKIYLQFKQYSWSSEELEKVLSPFDHYLCDNNICLYYLFCTFVAFSQAKSLIGRWSTAPSRPDEVILQHLASLRSTSRSEYKLPVHMKIILFMVQWNVETEWSSSSVVRRSP